MHAREDVELARGAAMVVRGRVDPGAGEQYGNDEEVAGPVRPRQASA
jgi:hypothetical protein